MTAFPLNMADVLEHPERCVVCRRTVSAKTLDAGRATMIKVDTQGNRTDDLTAFSVVVGPECRSSL